MTLGTAALLAPLVWAVQAAAEGREMIDLPSGAQVYLQETIVDRLGDTGLTHRYRYVMPDLALRVPATVGPAGEFGDSPPLDIDALEGPVDGIEDQYLDDGLIDPSEFDFSPVITLPGTEEAADEIIDMTLADDWEERLPTAPESSFRDPVHDDLIWLCENHVLPQVVSARERPGQIVISVADRESAFGEFDPDVLQLFEAFSLPSTRDACEWRPW